jgi:hypothetical protein
MQETQQDVLKISNATEEILRIDIPSVSEDISTRTLAIKQLAVRVL